MSSIEDITDEERGGDTVGSTLFNVPETEEAVTGTRTMRPPRNKTLSDIANMIVDKHNPDAAEATTEKRRRQKSSSDVVVMFGNAPVLGYDDMKLAENVAAYGTTRERQASNAISEKEFFEKVDEPEYEGFEFNTVGLTSEEAAILLAKHGPNELPEKIEPKWKIFLKQFWAPMPIMIWIAIIIEVAIANYIDMGILLLIQFANASISFYEITKAGNAIAALKSSLKPLATCKRDGKFKEMNATQIVPGDLVLLASGSAIPADCRVNHSEIDVDQAALTGESLPVTFYKGDSCKMGSTVVRGEVEVSFGWVPIISFLDPDLISSNAYCSTGYC
jgi:hypothetical protein